MYVCKAHLAEHAALAVLAGDVDAHRLAVTIKLQRKSFAGGTGVLGADSRIAGGGALRVGHAGAGIAKDIELLDEHNQGGLGGLANLAVLAVLIGDGGLVAETTGEGKVAHSRVLQQLAGLDGNALCSLAAGSAVGLGGQVK